MSISLCKRCFLTRDFCLFIMNISYYVMKGRFDGRTCYGKAKRYLRLYLDVFDKKEPIGDLYSKAVAEYLERFIKTENCFMYTLIEKDVILGLLTACEIPGILSRNIKIDTVAIAPEYQNKGYGTVMMNEFFKLFENAVFSLETKRNSISYKLYTKVGFKEVNGCLSMCKYDSK